MSAGFRRHTLGFAAILLVALSGAHPDGRSVNWPVYGGQTDENHYSPLDQINRTTIGRLKPVSAIDLDVPRANSEPIAVDGVLYVTGGLSIVQAFDVETGKRLWRFEPKLDTAPIKMRFAWGARGLAYDHGRVFVGAQDGQLFAIDAKTGKLDWSVQTTEGQDDGRYITGAPRVFDGKVIIGHGGADFAAVRGYVTAYDVVSGKQLWRFYTVPGDPAKGFEDATQAMAAKTWSGEYWKHGGGGTVWNAITYDPEFGRIYLGTGNGAPWNPKIRSPRGGDDLFLASIVALDAKTGKYLWHYQENPNEAWDYNSTMDIELATLAIDGKARKVILHAPKNGFFYVIDRESGKLISADKLGKVTWADRIDLQTGRPVENPGMRYADGTASEVWPGNLGLHNWPPMAFNSGTGLVYIPAIETGMKMTDKGVDPAHWEDVPGMLNNGVPELYADGFPATSAASLIAWDPVRKTKAWQVKTPAPWNGGALTTAGKLVFQGQIDGHLVAYDAVSGKPVWRYAVNTAAGGTPISYAWKDRQYVSLVIGPPLGSQFSLEGASAYGYNFRTQPARIVTFALDGTGTIPKPAVAGPEQPLVDPSMKLEPAMVKLGGALWGGCMGCHGTHARSPGSAPDLRASPLHHSQDAFVQVVRKGALAQRGMPPFPELNDDQIEALRQYIEAMAREGH
ncbi:PQQ-dependent dehydrogenase, methanol/ethanol family [Sphingomonas sp. MMS24-J13]|uniref:PQQ-dependent dehydrogenase, methanol/ethanol family n=1 Tax=Sphingomonas sp. MMS24-J13 TaxID=3238686 RepID=UPI0038503CDE